MYSPLITGVVILFCYKSIKTIHHTVYNPNVVLHNASCPPSFNKEFTIGKSLFLKRLYFGTVNRQTIKEFMQIKAKNNRKNWRILLRKGECGKIAIFGGCVLYTGNFRLNKQNCLFFELLFLNKKASLFIANISKETKILLLNSQKFSLVGEPW